ncbi:hypothetical protein VTP01DRAFT_1340 [Rhizomucor pusillus]|uniref:uncharacterized protein n=1 Tax=Rhizomucor pusillus TaxID=4840 RepID=UPI003743B23D
MQDKTSKADEEYFLQELCFYAKEVVPFGSRRQEANDISRDHHEEAALISPQRTLRLHSIANIIAGKRSEEARCDVVVVLCTRPTPKRWNCQLS